MPPEMTAQIRYAFLDEALETADRERLTAHQLARLRSGLRR
jgi:hypothetical protein